MVFFQPIEKLKLIILLYKYFTEITDKTPI